MPGAEGGTGDTRAGAGGTHLSKRNSSFGELDTEQGPGSLQVLSSWEGRR